jgi:hypothetical protein
LKVENARRRGHYIIENAGWKIASHKGKALASIAQGNAL